MHTIGRGQYAQAGKWIGYDLVANPDALGESRAAARVAFAYYFNWKNPKSANRAVEFIKLKQPAWIGVRKNNTDQETFGPETVAARSEMVLGRIAEAPPTTGADGG